MFTAYLHELNALSRTGQATEHSYRPALQACLTALLPHVQVTNEPKRQKCGAPDYILSRRAIDIGYIEAKDIGVDLDRVERGSKDDDQWKRYTNSLENLILTDYLEFRFFVDGRRIEKVRIAEVTPKGIVAKPENFAHLKNLLMDFAAFQGPTITSSKKLAAMMAHKAALMREVFFKALTDATTDSSLKDQLAAFKSVLMHDMTEAQFADVYAQTIAYGLFTARLHDESARDFSRAEALTLIPKSNPFLRQLFHYVAGPELDDRVVWIIDALCEVYRATDLGAVLQDFGASSGQHDPVLHFYETFLDEYDPRLRKARGVWYTPEPAVRFIVRAVDDVLKTHFGLPDGLAHTGKVEIEVEGHAGGKTTQVREDVHKVQVLDVATGTGTFLAEVIRNLHGRFKGQEGVWSSYVERHVLPRVHGFEILMAPYAMCHMKLDMLLTETGYRPSDPAKPPRLSVYLTNSLEEHHPDSGTLFASWLSREANAASRIKRDVPIMVALGNPPYSGHSANKGTWIEGLLEVYKKEPGGKEKLKEKNGKWLNDDYVKFIRLGEHYIKKNGEGILAYVTNHGYLDNPTFRGMRWHLLTTFDEIYVLDLHGNAKKREVALDGLADHNIFDIQQGVAMMIAIKGPTVAGRPKKLARVYHHDLWGTRESKYRVLATTGLKKMGFKPLPLAKPDYLFIPQDNTLRPEYNAGFALNELFPTHSVGIVTARDDLTIHDSRDQLVKTIHAFAQLPPEIARNEFRLGPDALDWKVHLAQEDLKRTNFNVKNIKPICYRPFDQKWTYYTGRSKGFHCRPRGEVMRHFLVGENVGLIVSKRVEIEGFSHVFMSKNVIQHHTMSLKEVNFLLPLWVYDEDLGDSSSKRPNLDPKIYRAIQAIVPRITPESLLDYVYAVLHSRAYRTRYATFLKSDFPRIPYPKDAATFRALAVLGGKLRELHLMESPVLETLITSYPVDGTHDVKEIRWEEAPSRKGLGRVWINPTQFFDHVPRTAWELTIGGYLPAQKWLKDRKGRALTTDDMRHWQRIIVALTETDRAMEQIDALDCLPTAQA